MSFVISHLATILLLQLTLLFPIIRAQRSFYHRPVPLAVRSPYLTTWDHLVEYIETAADVYSLMWPPTTYNDTMSLGWSFLVRVDGVTYPFLGDENTLTGNGTLNLTNVVVTPTQTVIAAQAGPMQVNLTFLNPIEPGDWVKQSIPFSYIAFTANSSDGASHAVQVYSDITGEWNSGDRNQEIRWNTTFDADVIYHSVNLETPAVFTEIFDQAEWGTLYYAMQTGLNVTYKIGVDQVSRSQFVNNGTLDNQGYQDFRPINQNSSFSVFALSRDLGTIQTTPSGFHAVFWTVGYTTDPAVNYTDLSGAPPKSRSLYYKTKYSNDGTLIVDFINDFSNASSRAQQLDQKILQDAASVSNMLGEIVSLAIAQVYGSTQLTVGTDASGNFNDSDIMIFMKNIGGAQANRVNPVEVLYAAFPAFMYIDPSLGGPLLEPLFRLQASPNYTIPFAAADLGSSYPNISGSNSYHNQGIEKSGNMLIMTYAYVRASGDGSLISRYYPLLTSWANYLINSTLYTHNQSSADGLAVSNQTNLAIKGIIAIEAMSKMSTVVNQAGDANKYSSAAGSLYGQWKNLALSNDQHILAAYGQANSWTLGYNLFADVWLGTNLVKSTVYDGQSSFINNMTFNMASSSNFGMPVDNIFPDTNVAFSSWNLFAAAMTTDEDLRSQLISKVHNWTSYSIDAFTNSVGDSGIFPVNYDNANGSALGGVASPAQGAVFAPIALKALVQLNVTTTTTAPSNTKSKTFVIAGGIIGASVAVLLVIGLVVFVRRRRGQGRPKSILSNSGQDVSQTIITPFNPIPSEATLPVDQAVDRLGGTSTEQLSPSGPSQPVAPIPIGLSDKDIAQLRARTLNSQPSYDPSTSNVPQSMPSPDVVNETSGATLPYDPRVLHSEVETLVRREMERLRAEELVTVAPPSYSEGDGQ